MLKIEKTVTVSPEQMEIIIEGARNPMDSWERMDSGLNWYCEADSFDDGGWRFQLGDNDHKLLSNLAKGGPVHAKYRRMIPVWVTLTSSLYLFKELDTYKVGTVCNSCSTMHRIHAKEFTMDDFSHEHMSHDVRDTLVAIVDALNIRRKDFLETKQKTFWWDMIQLLPSSYNQKRTYMFNYEVLHNIYQSRKNHKLDEWHTFCEWIESLPYADLITGNLKCQ